LSENSKFHFNKSDDETKKEIILSQVEILELAVKVVVNPTYGWLTAALIIYGCRPIETISLIPFPDGTASVIDFSNNKTYGTRRKVLAIPFDFVEKLNLYDQVSQPIFFNNIEDYDFNKSNELMNKWNIWFKSFIKNDLELDYFRNYWAERIIHQGVSEKLAAKYMGINPKEFKLKYT
tara:strand:+ start:414 stop:947 length:534 start_codon:yes stop_codon:yes gene_type:complete